MIVTDDMTTGIRRTAVGICKAYVYAGRMPEVIAGKPKRKAMFLSPEALRNLAATASRRRTEREAMEEALELLATRDAQRDAMRGFIEWATAEWGTPTEAESARADEIWSNR
jgi:hypothetical protein